jgi:hypothetical protein
MKNIHSQVIDGEAKAKPEVIKLGLDLHVRQVTECRQLDGSTPKPARQRAPIAQPGIGKAAAKIERRQSQSDGSGKLSGVI